MEFPELPFLFVHSMFFNTLSQRNNGSFLINIYHAYAFVPLYTNQVCEFVHADSISLELIDYLSMCFYSVLKLLILVTNSINLQLHGFTLEANPEGGTLEASFSPDGQFVISGLL